MTTKMIYSFKDAALQQFLQNRFTAEVVSDDIEDAILNASGRDDEALTCIFYDDDDRSIAVNFIADRDVVTTVIDVWDENGWNPWPAITPPRGRVLAMRIKRKELPPIYMTAVVDAGNEIRPQLLPNMVMRGYKPKDIPHAWEIALKEFDCGSPD